MIFALKLMLANLYVMLLWVFLSGFYSVYFYFESQLAGSSRVNFDLHSFASNPTFWSVLQFFKQFQKVFLFLFPS